MNEPALLLDADLLFDPARIVLPASWAGHVPFAAWLMAKQQPRRFVELGTHTGFSYSTFCQTVVEHGLPTQCYAVDTWQGDDHAGFYDDRVFQELSLYHDQRYSGFSRLLRMTFDDALNYFSEGSVDLLHIDGLHTYEAVHHDFSTWKSRLSDRAIVLFHDTNVREHGFGVWELWEELAAIYPHIHFEHSHGLGVLLVGSDVSPDVVALQQLYEHNPVRVKQAFCLLGQRVELKAKLMEYEQRLCEQHEQLESAKDDHEQQLAGQQKQLDALLSSRSWRITSPLRSLGNIFRG